MKEVYKWLITLVVLVFLVFVMLKLDKKTKHLVVPDVHATTTDSTITTQLRRQIGKKDSLINALELKLTNTQETAFDLHIINKRLKISVDTLYNYYRANKTLKNCDSLVADQKNYIYELEIENDSVHSEAEQYSRILYIERGKIEDFKVIVSSKETLIAAYQKQFSRIDCMYDWTSKHKFWSWILGIKCR